MEMNPGIFMFIVALCAVVNGLGIVRIVGGLGEFIRRRHSLQIDFSPIYFMLVVFQLLTHVLLWWSLIGLRDISSINFLQFLYLVIGPILLYLSTNILVPDFDGPNLDMRKEYWRSYKAYYAMLSVFWAWALFVWPVFGYPLAPTWKFAACWLAISAILRFTDNEKAHIVLASAIWLLMVLFIGMYALQLGGVASQLVP